MVRMGFAFVASYLLGSFPTAYLIVKWRTGQDIRRIGSGNVGATNTARAAGKEMGALVFLIDATKGFVATLLPLILLHHDDPILDPRGPFVAMRLLCGGMAVVGHNFPWSLGFRGGKGVATTIGALLGADPAIAGLAGVVWVIVAALSRYVSVASMAAAISLPLGQWWMKRSPPECALGAALGALILIRHHRNMARLRDGCEPRIDSARAS